ncbi:Uncharacterized protein HZ326_30393 [Fusarium oxysporum f. sp. albedinis]|nr:Uncharacterized protein HZ326_30393 [Fusarium oxysporum f. sp. albedinis]
MTWSVHKISISTAFKVTHLPIFYCDPPYKPPLGQLICISATLSCKKFSLAPAVSVLLGVFIDTELRELLTLPPGAISYVVFASSFYLDIPASRAFNNPGSAPLDFPSGCRLDYNQVRHFCLTTSRQHRRKPLGRNGTELTWGPRKEAAVFSCRASFWPPWVFLLTCFGGNFCRAGYE